MSAVASPSPVSAPRKSGVWRFVRRNPTLVAGAAILVVMALIAIFAPWIRGRSAAHPAGAAPAAALRAVLLGTDGLGRDVFARNRLRRAGVPDGWPDCRRDRGWASGWLSGWSRGFFRRGRRHNSCASS